MEAVFEQRDRYSPERIRSFLKLRNDLRPLERLFQKAVDRNALKRGVRVDRIVGFKKGDRVSREQQLADIREAYNC